jgi:hypothetical protein
MITTSDQKFKYEIEKADQEQKDEVINTLINRIRSLGEEYPECAEALNKIAEVKGLTKAIGDAGNSVAQSARSKSGKKLEQIIINCMPDIFKDKIGIQEQIHINHITGCLARNQEGHYKGKEDLIPYLKTNGEFKEGDKIPCLISSKCSLRERFKQDSALGSSIGKVYLVSKAKEKDISIGKITEMRNNGCSFVMPDYIYYPKKKHWKDIRNQSITLEEMWKEIYLILSKQ